MVNIEVAYAKPEAQFVVALTLPEGTALDAAVKASGLLERFPEIALPELNVGVFGVVCKPDQIIKEGYRIEIYRSLRHDPKEARRQRALKQA
ncbi:MAG: RnfH family protein [Methylobacter sp.]|nr:RnfH family protein [Methylobacter sp.]MDP2428178.1 RnfH family protein [Methylobacter sp.]MDP3053143.1 RnfH family protein [Methylobacter sp.]MDP3363939.1 RnfH family protein [Methylobacter sp.]MDZ4218145.1 RnfH family protein [Methylobacter sp.]